MSGRMMGVDVGGSGVKGGVVDLATGDLVGERHKLATPKPATPQAVAEIVGYLSPGDCGMHGHVAKHDQERRLPGVRDLDVGVDPVRKEAIALGRVAASALAVQGTQKLLQVKSAGKGGHLQRPLVDGGVAYGDEADL